MRASGLESAERHLHHPDRQSGKRHERLVLLTEAVERCRRSVQRAVEVVDDRQDPRDRQLGGALEIRVVDAPVESLEPLDRGQSAVIVTNLDGGHG